MRDESSWEMHSQSAWWKLLLFSQTAKLISFARLMGQIWREFRESLNPWINSLKGSQLQCPVLYPQSVMDQSQSISTTILINQLQSTRTQVWGSSVQPQRGQAIPTAENYRIESTSDDSHIRTMNCNALSVELESGWAVVDEMRQLSPMDNDQIMEDQKLSMWKIMAKHSNVEISRGPHDIGHCAKAQLRINTGTATPARLPLRHFSPQQEGVHKREDAKVT